MKYTNLKNTKIKLTVIFTILVFVLAFILEWIFFSSKYYGYISKEEEIFNRIASTIEKSSTSLNDYISNYNVWKRLFKMEQRNFLTLYKDNREDFINIIIINKSKNKVSFSNVIDNISVELVKKILNNNKYKNTEQKEWYLIKKISIIENSNNYDVIFIRHLKYSFIDYLEDLFNFILITILFSILIFYIWYKFVSNLLIPVENNLKDMHNFIHNAWHELKTPLSIIHSNLQLINHTKKYDKELINEWLIEIIRLNKLIESLIELSNLSSNLQTENVNINNEINLIIKDFKNESNKKKININIFINYDKNIIVNKQYFYILFSNLLWNAIKYNNIWWSIDILLNKNNLIIRDNWIWIKSENINKIFDRFFISNECRNCDGHWIWLSLVKKIINIFKWKIVVKSKLWEWSEFNIKF